MISVGFFLLENVSGAEVEAAIFGGAGSGSAKNRLSVERQSGDLSAPTPLTFSEHNYAVEMISRLTFAMYVQLCLGHFFQTPNLIHE
jgi:hypothetical protein